ncbi:hypothetical protein [Helicobacter aurati]|nr:hypothetical protein [Helicobacter aurati]
MVILRIVQRIYALIVNKPVSLQKTARMNEVMEESGKDKSKCQ